MHICPVYLLPPLPSSLPLPRSILALLPSPAGDARDSSSIGRFRPSCDAIACAIDALSREPGVPGVPGVPPGRGGSAWADLDTAGEAAVLSLAAMRDRNDGEPCSEKEVSKLSLHCQ